MTDGMFSVCRWFKDGSHEYVRRFVDGEEAVAVFNHYTKHIATTAQIAERVVIVDSLDHINYEWKRGIGITYPKEGQGGEELRDD